MQLTPPRGTRDFYPDEMRVRNHIFRTWRETALSCGFEEYDSSILEHEELYVLKSGPEILEQLYGFVDKGGRRVALRPEMTPTLARMIASRGNALPKPVKWFSIAQCFRYERMSRGRKREHYQWNLDIVGVADVTAEAELLAAALWCLERLGLGETDVVVRISHRGLLGSVLKGLQVSENAIPEVFRVIDKRGKEPDEDLKLQMENLGLPQAPLGDLFALLDQKNIDVFSSFFEQRGVETGAVRELKSLFALLEGYGVMDSCEFAPSIVRGLPYYTGIVFECFDRKARFRAIFGGGRYDHLLGLISGQDQRAAGLGFGDVVIQEILEADGRWKPPARSVDFFLVPFSEQERPAAVEILQRIRKQGPSADILLTPKKLKGALRDAARIPSRFALLLLPDELREGVLILRDLESGTETRMDRTDFLRNPRRVLEP